MGPNSQHSQEWQTVKNGKHPKDKRRDRSLGQLWQHNSLAGQRLGGWGNGGFPGVGTPSKTLEGAKSIVLGRRGRHRPE